MDVSTLRQTPVRRFTLLDGMLFVAATGCGLAADKAINSFIRLDGAKDALDLLGSYFGDRQYLESATIAMVLTMPIAASWTLVLIPLGLLAPRPRLRKSACRPGWIAACAFAVALLLCSTVIVVLLASSKWMQLDALEFTPLLPILVAPAILVAWLTLILVRRWRPEPTWLDRLGRALGIFWLVMVIVGPAVLATAFF